MKYFPPLDRNRPAWAARIRNLGSWGLAVVEKYPTIVAMSGYLMNLDDLCDMQQERVRVLTQHTEDVETRWRKAKVTLALAEARVTEAECRVVLVEEKLREQVDRHSQLLREMHMTIPANLQSWMGFSCLSPRKRLLGFVPPTTTASPRSSNTEDPEYRVVGPAEPVGLANS
jgi:hypothetical protein